MSTGNINIRIFFSVCKFHPSIDHPDFVFCLVACLFPTCTRAILLFLKPQRDGLRMPVLFYLPAIFIVNHDKYTKGALSRKQKILLENK